MPKQTNRKNEHVSLAEKFYPRQHSPFNDIQFIHHSLPGIDVADVDLSTSVAGLTFSAPFFINAMTGGSDWTGRVNEKLAIIARECQLAMATGSISAGLKFPDMADSYRIVRQTHPNGLIFANLGAGHSVENAQRAVDLLQADGLQIHVNAPQEIVMPEGDRSFCHWLDHIQAIVDNISVPIIVKEVGFGMSRKTIQLLDDIGVDAIDISGRGGTNFAQIENYRRKDYKLDILEDWGQTTPVSLLEAGEVSLKTAEIIASGGIRTPLEMTKALALGAHLVGLSGEFLHLALNDIDQAITTVQQWKETLTKIYTILGAQSTPHLQQAQLILRGDTAHWCYARGIDITQYSQR